MDSSSPASRLPSTLSRSSSKAWSRASKITRNSSPASNRAMQNSRRLVFFFFFSGPPHRHQAGITRWVDHRVREDRWWLRGPPKEPPGRRTNPFSELWLCSTLTHIWLHSQLADQRSITAWNFGESHEFEKSQLPDIRTMRKIYNLASRGLKNNHPESSWNNYVHSPILDWVLRDSPRADDIVDYRCWYALS